jgi:hypothetical protein
LIINHLTTPLLFYRFSIILAILSLLLLGSCTQRETDIGANAIVSLPADSFKITSDTASYSTDWIPHYTNGLGASLEVGDAKGLFAYTVVRFDVFSGIPDSIIVDSLVVHLYRNRVWPGPGLPGTQVRVREIPDSATWTENDLIPGKFAGREQFPVLDSLALGETDTVLTYQIRDPQSVWQRWRADTSMGLIIEPRFGGGFIEFYSREAASAYVPYLFIHGRALRTSDTTWVDSSFVSQASGDGYLVLDSTAHSPGRFFIAQGHAVRGALYFSMDSTLIGNFRRSVNRAELRIYADTTDAAEIRFSTSNMLIKHGLLSDSTWISHADTLLSSLVVGSESSNLGIWDSTSTEVRIDVSGAVANWVANPSQNGGLQVIAYNELGTLLSREVFFGPQADDPTKRPRLYIWFTDTSH